MRAWIYFLSCGFIFAVAYQAGKNDMRQLKNAEIATIRAEHAAQIAQNTEISNGAFAHMMEQKNDAIEKYAKENAKLRRAADNARAADERLRRELAAAERDLESAPAAACVEFGRTAAQLLRECTAEYRSVAQAADEHAAHARMMRDAWPRPEDVGAE